MKYFRLYGRKWHIKKGQSVYDEVRSAECGVEALTKYLVGYCGAEIRDSVFCRERSDNVNEISVCKRCLKEYRKKQ